MLNWRLPWVFACPRHLCLLAESCPHCGREQTLLNGWWQANSVPETKLCRELTDRDGNATRCSGPLESARTLRIPKHSALLDRQQQILDLLTGADISCGIYREQPVSSSQILIDIRALSMRLLDAAPAQRLLQTLGFGANSIAAQQWIRHLDRAGDRGELPIDQWFGPSAPAQITAIGISAALSVIDSTSLDDAGAKLAAYPCHKNKRITPVKVRQGLSPSPQLCATELLSRAEKFTAFDDLRYRRYSSLPRRPEAPTSAANNLLTRIPTQFWYTWALRLVPGEPRLWRPSRHVLSIMLASVGSTEAEPNIQRALNFARDSSSVDHVARQLRQRDTWPKIAEALILLKDYLQTESPPINYQRRREIGYRGLLPEGEWADLRPLADAGRIGGNVAGAARAWLYERISGMSWRTAPFADTISDSRTSHDRFLVILSNELRDELDRLAERLLAANDIHGEPILWEPPEELLASVDLLGPELNPPPNQTLERIRGGGMTIDEAAQDHRVDRNVIRYWLQCAPADLQAPSRKSKLRSAKGILDRATLEQLYVGEQRSFVEIARTHGIDSPEEVSELAVQYGIPRRRDTPIAIDPEWIRHQHIQCGRTFGEIAQEAGVSPWSVLNIARRNDIPITKYPKRLPNEKAMAVVQTIPSASILLPAMADKPGWIRLTRFAVATNYSHLSRAANFLGISRDVLCAQVARLEKDLGQMLIYRSTSRASPMQISDFGGRVAKAVQLVERTLAKADC